MTLRQKETLNNNEKWVKIIDDNETYYVTYNSDMGYILLNDKLQRLDNQDYGYELRKGKEALNELD